jgi:glycosyltransferase involved in cell wall biosynthesis
MRIVLDLQACQTSGSRTRGIGRYSMSLSLAMARQARGHEVIIALNNQFADTVEPVRNMFDGLIDKNNIKVFHAFGPLAELDPSNVWRTRAAERVREAFLAKLNPDIVYVSSLLEGLGDDAVTSTDNFNGAFDTAVTLYDLIPLLHKETYLTNPRVRDWYYRKLLGLKNAGLLLSISEHSRREAIEALQLRDDHVVNISSAVDPIFLPRTLSIEEAASLRSRYQIHKPFVMYTGGIDYRKNIDGLIEAYARLPGDLRSQYQLAIVCSMRDEDRHKLEGVITRCGLSKADVILTGFVPEVDLIALYNACTLFVFPSFHEGFGLPVLEAMRCGAAVIGSNTSSIPEVLGREDALFDPRDNAAITAKMHEVLTNPDFMTSLQRHGPEQAKLFSWDASAQRAWDALEHRQSINEQEKSVTVAVSQVRSRMAYFSPLPPEKSGIADYSAELLPELAHYYDIDVVTPQTEVSDPWIRANFPVRTLAWFEEHAHEYDRILYHFGNSGFHQHMFDLLPRHPGVVVLHDFFMSGALHYADQTGFSPGCFVRALYESHGYPALRYLQQHGREETIWQFPSNKPVLEQALGIIVHSNFSKRLADDWYGQGTAAQWQLVPFMRAMPGMPDRKGARKQLGLSDDDFLVCSFGLLGETKLNDRLLHAWLASELAQDPRCHLVLVGENHGGRYGYQIQEIIAQGKHANQVKITGFASQELYRTYLAAADASVQLRTRSRGETSGTILDCLAYGLPTIINAHGSAADFPDQAVLKLNDEFSVADLTNALTALHTDTGLRGRLAEQARSYARSVHHPIHIRAAYHTAIEHLSNTGKRAHYQRLIRSLKTIDYSVPPSAQDLKAVADSIHVNIGIRLVRQILVDVSDLQQHDAHSAGAADAALTLRLLRIWMEMPVAGYRVEPVYYAADASDDADGIARGGYKYARKWALGIFGMHDVPLNDAAVDIQEGDILISVAELNDVPDRAAAARYLQGFGVRHVCLQLTSLEQPKQHGDAGEFPTRFIEWIQALETGSPLVYARGRSLDNVRQQGSVLSRADIKLAARRTLHIDEHAFVVCASSFSTFRAAGEEASAGTASALKNAWEKLPAAFDRPSGLVLVGDCPNGMHQHEAGSPGTDKGIHFVSRNSDDFPLYMQAADVVLELEEEDKDSSLIQSAFAHDVPMIMRASDAALQAVGQELPRISAQQAEPIISTSTVPEEHAADEADSRIRDVYRSYIEQATARRTGAGHHAQTANMMVTLPATQPAGSGNTIRQLLVDVSMLAQLNLNSGIQRVVHHVLIELLASQPAGFQVLPVRSADGFFVYANKFTSRIANLPEQPDSPVRVRAGDVFLGLDLSPDGVRENQRVLEDYRTHGVDIYFVVYDLLPVLRPDVFPKAAQANFVNWLERIVEISDGLIGISRSVADEIADWVKTTKPAREKPLHLGYFHLGADARPDGRRPVPAVPSHRRPCILMVGTVEPRKGYAQALSAFERLWNRGVEIDLAIVGRQGWMVEDLVARLRTHPEHSKHLFWFESASDEILEALYSRSSALLLASEGEGFGLPLVESALHGMPIIARDLPVFREVAAEHAFYFEGTSPDALESALQSWLLQYSKGVAPASSEIRCLSWHESAAQLQDSVIHQRWYRTVGADDEAIAESPAPSPAPLVN